MRPLKPATWLLLCSACAASSTPAQRDSAPRVQEPRIEASAVQREPSELAAKSVEPLDGSANTKPATWQLPAPSTSTSVGSVTNGRLMGGVGLPDEVAGLRFNERRKSEARYGTVEVIGAMVQAAQHVRSKLPDSELIVNDVSLLEGGSIAHHGSHRAGRDADILFYLRDDAGRPIRSVGAPIDPDGIGFDYQDLSVLEDDVRVHFDAERTWLLVASLLESRAASVQRIFVAEHLRTMLLREAERVGAGAETIARFADVTCQPSYPHDDHLHVRWFCSAEDIAQGCEDLPPLYPFRDEELRAQGITAVLAKSSRSVDPAPVTTQKQAQRAVERKRPHPNVLAFLARRKSWEKQPHPGRKYCR